MAILEKPFEFFAYKLARTTKLEYNAATFKLSRIIKEKKTIEKQITDAHLRDQQQKADEKIRIQKEISKAKEWKFITTLNDAVDIIQGRKMSFEAATNLLAKLQQEYNLIHYLYYHTNVYYDNRFYKIRAALGRYEIKDTDATRSATPEYSKIPVNNKPELNSTETNKVEHFSPNYIPVGKTGIPIIKTELPDVFDKPVTKIDPTSISVRPVIKLKPPPVSIPIVTKIEPPAAPGKRVSEPTAPVVPENLIVQEIEISELFNDKKATTTRAPNNYMERDPVKIDYVKLNEARANTGKLGELFALDWEIKRLERQGLKKYCDKVVQVSLVDDSRGYDILSFCDDGRPKYIEVKTTTDSWNSPFYLTENELTAMDNLNDYFIYRVYAFSIEAKRGTIFLIDCDKNIEKYYEIKPVSYRVSPK